MSLDLLFALALVVASGFFVASEFALARFGATQVAELDQHRRVGGGRFVTPWPTSTHILLGVTVASIGPAVTQQEREGGA